MTAALHPRGLGRDAALWAGAAVLALATHVGVGLWASRQVVEPFAEATSPPAIMIDMAPEIAAPQDEMEQFAPDAADAPEIESVDLDAPPALEPPPAPLEPPPPLDEPPPTLETPPEPDPVVEPPAIETPPDVLSEVVEPPPSRPSATPPEPKPETPREDPKPEAKPAAPRKEQVKAALDAPAPAAKPTAPTTSDGAQGSPGASRKWQARLQAHLKRHLRYPSASKSRREEGVALVRFSIDQSGAVQSVQLVRSSGFPELDEAATATIRRASPVPDPPPGAPLQLTVPMEFNIK